MRAVAHIPPKKNTTKNIKGNMLIVYERLYLVRHFLSRGIVKIVGVMCSLCVVSRLQVGFSQPLPRSAEVAYSVRGSFF